MPAATLGGYARSVALISGPLLLGTSLQRAEFTSTGLKPAGSTTVDMLGHLRVQDLTTSDIRAWHKTVSNEVGWYSANRAKMFLGSVSGWIGGDFSDGREMDALAECIANKFRCDCIPSRLCLRQSTIRRIGAKGRDGPSTEM